MAKSKSGPALFDLLGDEEATKPEQLKVPRWWESGSAKSSVPAREAGPSTPERPADTLPPASSERTGSEAPLFELDDDRIRISLTSVSAGLVVFAILVVVFGAFELGRNLGNDAAFKAGVAAGRASYEAEVLSDIEIARAQPPATDLVEELLVPAEESAPSEAPAGAAAVQERPWIPGHTYIVVQEFTRGHESDAAKVQAYLLERGIATERVAYASGSVQLITVQGYNRDEPGQRAMADALLSKVHALGQAYFEGGGGYRLQGYFKTLKGDTW